MDRHCFNNNQYTAYTYPHWHILCAQRSQMLSIFFLSAMLILLPKLFIEFNHHIVDIPFFLHCFSYIVDIPFFLQKLITAPILPYISRNHRRNLKNLDWFRTLKTFTRLATLFVQIIDVLNFIGICLFFSKCSIALHCRPILHIVGL